MNDDKHTQAYRYLASDFEEFKRKNMPIFKNGISADRFVPSLVDAITDFYSPDSLYGGNLTQKQSETACFTIQKFRYAFNNVGTVLRFNELVWDDCMATVRRFFPERQISFFQILIDKLLHRSSNDNGMASRSEMLNNLIGDLQRQANTFVVVDPEAFFGEIFNLLSYVDSLLAEYLPFVSDESNTCSTKSQTLDHYQLSSYQKLLGVLGARKELPEITQGIKQLEEILEEYGVSVKWPNVEELDESEFVTFYVRELREKTVYSPCIKEKSRVVLKGRVGIPRPTV